jgi:hypothetical protein
MKTLAVLIKHHKILISLALVIMLFAVLIPSSPVLASPVLTLVPTSGAVGMTVTVSGTVFDSYKGDNIHIFFDDAEIANSPLVVPPEGTFSVDFIVPTNAATGNHSVEVRSETPQSSMLARNVFVVEAASLTISISEGWVYTSVVVAGSGFCVGKPVRLQYMSATLEDLGTVIASDTGSFTYQFAIPISAAGFHKITAANDLGNHGETQFKVLPQFTLNLASAGSGDIVSASGMGFANNSTVNILLGSVKIATTTTDELGSFKDDIEVPFVKPDPYDVTAQDSQGNSGATRFTVTAGAKLSENVGTTGSELTVTGSGFIAGHIIEIKYDNDVIATTEADNNGDFTATFIVPTGGGKHLITVTDGSTTKKINFNLEKEPPPVPTLLLPNNNTETKAEAFFDWTDVTASNIPVTYELEIASDQNFASIIFDKTKIEGSQYTLSQSEILAAEFKDTPYYWRIRAIDGADNKSEWSSSWSFHVSVPSKPTLILPASNAKSELPVHFSWESTTSLSPPLTYQLQIAANPDFASLILNKTELTSSDYIVSEDSNLNLKNDTTYYWRVKATDKSLNSSDWSATGSFNFIAPSGFPVWAICVLAIFGGLIALLVAFRAGRRTAYH